MTNANPTKTPTAKQIALADKLAALVGIEERISTTEAATKLGVTPAAVRRVARLFPQRFSLVVRKEWDKQRGNYSHAFFGGAGVCKRMRAYVHFA
jgi:hypothetical protein